MSSDFDAGATELLETYGKSATKNRVLNVFLRLLVL